MKSQKYGRRRGMKFLTLSSSTTTIAASRSFFRKVTRLAWIVRLATHELLRRNSQVETVDGVRPVNHPGIAVPPCHFSFPLWLRACVHAQMDGAPQKIRAAHNLRRRARENFEGFAAGARLTKTTQVGFSFALNALRGACCLFGHQYAGTLASGKIRHP